MTRSQRVNGATVLALRERNGQSQTELAVLARVERSYLSRIESGDRQPSASMAKRIADALKVPLVAILADPPESQAS